MQAEAGVGETRAHSRRQGLQQVLPELQGHQVGQAEREIQVGRDRSEDSGESGGVGLNLSFPPPPEGTHLPTSPGSACRDTSFSAR